MNYGRGQNNFAQEITEQSKPLCVLRSTLVLHYKSHIKIVALKCQSYV